MLFKLDPERSKITWTGFQPSGNTNSGTIQLASGKVVTEKENITEAEVVVDLKTIRVTEDELDTKKKETLRDHLLSDEFFNAQVNKTASFHLEKIERVSETDEDGEPIHHVTGNLKIGDITNQITVPVNLKYGHDEILIGGTIKFDRTRWNVNGMLDPEDESQKVLPEFEVDLHLRGHMVESDSYEQSRSADDPQRKRNSLDN